MMATEQQPKTDAQYLEEHLLRAQAAVLRVLSENPDPQTESDCEQARANLGEALKLARRQAADDAKPKHPPCTGIEWIDIGELAAPKWKCKGCDRETSDPAEVAG